MYVCVYVNSISKCQATRRTDSVSLAMTQPALDLCHITTTTYRQCSN